MESGEQLSVIFCARSIVSADVISVTPIIIFIIAVASKYSVIHGKWHGLAVEGEKVQMGSFASCLRWCVLWGYPAL